MNLENLMIRIDFPMPNTRTEGNEIVACTIKSRFDRQLFFVFAAAAILGAGGYPYRGSC
ncbi:hypothetical protein BBO01nite_46050 [Brevibacillus borstelensis]|nr:hypothetical protein BBO01nite_46050 [Brevibacillus borstelensis]